VVVYEMLTGPQAVRRREHRRDPARRAHQGSPIGRVPPRALRLSRRYLVGDPALPLRDTEKPAFSSTRRLRRASLSRPALCPGRSPPRQASHEQIIVVGTQVPLARGRRRIFRESLPIRVKRNRATKPATTSCKNQPKTAGIQVEQGVSSH
jgi:hypothetical protein